jgi:hypothetical protein
VPYNSIKTRQLQSDWTSSPPGRKKYGHTFGTALIHFAVQGCQIFSGTKYRNKKKCTKLPKNVRNVHKIDPMAFKYTKCPQNLPTSSIARPSKNYPILDFARIGMPHIFVTVRNVQLQKAENGRPRLRLTVYEINTSKIPP